MDEMRGRGLAPNRITFNTLMHALARAAGDAERDTVQRAMLLLDQMVWPSPLRCKSDAHLSPDP